MSGMSAWKRIAALLLLAVLGIECIAFADESGIALPEPPASALNMILGDSNQADTHEVTLYFAGENNSGMTSSTRAIPVKMNEGLIESTLRYLLSSRFSESGQGVSSDMQLIDVELAGGIVTVNLSIGSSAQLSDQSELLRSLSIANTLLSLEGVEAVNILTGGRSDAICSLPTGVYTQLNEAVSAQYAQLQSEREDFLARKAVSLKRNAVLYFPSANGYFLPELRSMEFANSNYAAAILEALAAGPFESARCFSPIPNGVEIPGNQSIVRVNDAGERVLELYFDAMLPNYLAFSGIQLWQFYGSIVLSMCSFMPELDGVIMYIEGAPIADYVIGDQITRFDENMMRRSDFASRIGSSAILYFADADSRLVRTEYPLSQASAASPKGLLSAMLATPAPEGLSSVFPAEVYADDLLGVQLNAGIATVNLSGSFYARCQNLDAAQERSLVYAMVNALCELPEIGAVRFLVEGMGVETLCKNIYLKTPLLPDPGVSIERNSAEGVLNDTASVTDNSGQIM